jgi:hypothetical protein
LLIKSICQNILHQRYFKCIKILKWSFVVSWSHWCFSRCFSGFKAIINYEPKRAAVYIENTFNVKSYKRERSMEKNSLVLNMRQIKLKREFRFNNSKQEFSICFKFCNSFRFYLFITKPRKLKTGCFYTNNNNKKANEDIYNLMISQQTTMDTIRVKEKKKVAQNCMTAF